tara:strand:+ start:871 stop:1065 length:195 start_codon:yes stop_codon:yes gene_type:complete
MGYTELRVLLVEADEHFHSLGAPEWTQVNVLRGIGKCLLVLAQLELEKSRDTGPVYAKQHVQAE